MVAVANTAQFYVLLAHALVRPGIPIPLSVFVSAALAVILVAAWRRPFPMRKTKGLFRVVVVAFACVVCFSLAQMCYLLRQMPYNMAREVAALWVYYLRPLVNA